MHPITPLLSLLLLVTIALPVHAHSLTDEQAGAMVEESLAELEATNIIESSIGVGQQAPDFALPGANDEMVRLSELLKDGPVILTFYRGGWCPVCNSELQSLQTILPDIHDLGAELVAIAPEMPSEAEKTRTKNLLTYPVLSDKGNKVAEAYGIAFTMPEKMQQSYSYWGLDVNGANGDTQSKLPIPATYIINQQGDITYAFKDVNYRNRAPHEEILAELHKLKDASLF